MLFVLNFKNMQIKPSKKGQVPPPLLISADAHLTRVVFIILPPMGFSSFLFAFFFHCCTCGYTIVQRTSFQVLLFYVSVAVTGGLCLNTVVLYNVPVLSLGMNERVFDASELLHGREQVQTRPVPLQALRGCTEAFTLGPPTDKGCHS